MSVEGDCDSPAASDAAIVELATRYGLFLLKANKMLDNDVYYLAIKSTTTKDPSEELLERFHRSSRQDRAHFGMEARLEG